MSPRSRVVAVGALVGILVAGGLLVPTSRIVPSSSPGGSETAGPALAPALLPTAAWPTYMGDPERTGANHLETALGPTTVSDLQELWQVQSSGSDFSAPIVVNGTVFFGSWDGNETAVNATDGSILWSTFLGTDAACGGGYSPMGISSTAAYHAGTLYLGGGDGYWYALSSATGAEEWRVLAGSEAAGYYDWASALVHAGSLYVGTASCFDSPLVAAGLLKVNLTTHAVVEEFNTTPSGQVGESIWTTPALDPENNTIWISTGNENPPSYPIYANAIIGLNASTLNVSGSWQVPDEVGQDSDFGSTPTLFRTTTGVPMVVATNKNGMAYALARSNVSRDGTWNPVWNLSTGGGFSGGAFDGRTLYLAGSSTVYAVDPANGSVLWTAPMDGGGTIYGSLAWANGVVYAGGGGTVEAIDATNGTVLWEAPLAVGQATVTEPVVVDGEVFVASGNYGGQGFLTAFGLPSPSAFRVRFQESGLPAGKSWSVSLGGSPLTTDTSSLAFLEPNGSFAYLLRGPRGFEVTGPSPGGMIAVSGANVSVSVGFARGPTPTVSFSENGLRKPTSWCVTIAGWSACSVRPRIALDDLTPGDYAYSVGPIPGYTLAATLHGVALPGRGTLAVAHGLSVHVHFVPKTYLLSFTESGLAPGTRWSVKLQGVVRGHETMIIRSSRNGTIDFYVPNGTFTYTVRAVRGYSGGGPGSVEIVAGPASEAVTFSGDPAVPIARGPPALPRERTLLGEP